LADQHHPPTENTVNLETISQTLLRIVVSLHKNGYSESKSNGQQRRQADELQLDDLPDPASEQDTSQG